MNKELIDKCLDFAEGNKGKFTILMIKKQGFPDTLIEGTEKQQEINKHIKNGLTIRETAEIMHCTHPNVAEHLRNYRRGVEFYYEWCEFWEYIIDIRQQAISSVFEDILNESRISVLSNKNIVTIGDFLTFTVTTKATDIFQLFKRKDFDADIKSKLFNRIREMCYKKLN